jgi:hypothetical protein
MSSTTVRISSRGLDLLRAISQLETLSQTAILEKALEEYRRNLFFAQANAAFEKLRADPVAWKEELEERKLWENTLMDGLKDEEAPR